MLSGILSLNNLNGSSAPMKISDCRFEHVFLEWFGLASAVAGVVTIFFSEYSSLFTTHSCSGNLYIYSITYVHKDKSS